jgi:hypothetical protein
MSVEIAFASIMFWKAFPYHEFSTGKGRTHIVAGMGKVLSVKELMQEARMAFKSYELDYSVHNDVWEDTI